jgi:hypothetical protein
MPPHIRDQTCPLCGVNQIWNDTKQEWMHLNNRLVECASELINPVSIPISAPRMSGTDLVSDIDSK